MQQLIRQKYRPQAMSRLIDYLDSSVSNAPLVSFRIVFGAVMVFSTLRFWYLGWIEDHFIDTQLTFKYFGFYWVELLPPAAMYGLHALMLLAAFGIMLGWFYRWSAILFFLSFTYVELIDITYYLNHYYFVSITSFLLILVPAQRHFSLDVWRKPLLYQTQCPRWCILIFKLQIAIVYIYAGLAKINYAWLMQALPLKIWLPAHDDLPLIGPLLRLDISAYFFSWVGMLYDCSIVFFLAWQRSRLLAYLSVLVFHGLTAMLFQIGVFPVVMMGATWIYFGAAFHERLLSWGAGMKKWFLPQNGGAPWRGGGASASWGRGPGTTLSWTRPAWLSPEADRPAWLSPEADRDGSGMRGAGRTSLRCAPFTHTKDAHQTLYRDEKVAKSYPRAHNSGQRGHQRSAVGAPHRSTSIYLLAFIGIYFAFQLLFPWRYQLYPGNVFWTEEGYRFAWRVMLMEKAGTATFYVKDGQSGREGVVDNGEFLRPHQEKQMAMQPDMIVQYAQFLADHYRAEGLQAPAVRAEVYVTLNARPSRLLIDPELDLTTVEDTWQHKKWILPYEE